MGVLKRPNTLLGLYSTYDLISRRGVEVDGHSTECFTQGMREEMEMHSIDENYFWKSQLLRILCREGWNASSREGGFEGAHELEHEIFSSRLRNKP